MTRKAGCGILAETDRNTRLAEQERDTMTDHELLLAISGIMDKKLIPIENRLDAMQDEIHIMQGEIRDMQGEIRNMQGEIRDMQGEIRNMQGEIYSIQGEIRDIQGEIHNIRLFQENVILPRLNTIESCYMDTYERYKSYADKIESVFADTELLKKVVSEHSEKLQKIS
jgi:predicted  nucleic acid-binding Zn-ribbon protein